MSKGIIIVDMPESCDLCRFSSQAYGSDLFEEGEGYCTIKIESVDKVPEGERPDWCPIQPKRKRLIDIAMEQDDVDVSEIECPREVRPEFQSYEKRCSSMSFVQCWGQEVDE